MLVFFWIVISRTAIFMKPSVYVIFKMSALNFLEVLFCCSLVVALKPLPKFVNLLFPLPDKFDQFWAVNRRLMEPIGDQEGFKHIPIRSYNEVRNSTIIPIIQ